MSVSSTTFILKIWSSWSSTKHESNTDLSNFLELKSSLAFKFMLVSNKSSGKKSIIIYIF